MKRFTFLILAIGLVVPPRAAGVADRPRKNTAAALEKDLEKVSGTFTVIRFVQDGTAYPAASIRQMQVVQEGTRWSFHNAGVVTQGTDVFFPTKKLKEVNSTYTSGLLKGQTVHGLYAVDCDTITYCWAAPGKKRPRAFVSTAGSGITLMVLQRVKAAPR